ncbi:MAG TPA: hypothetical protein PLK77_07505 [Pyrinomonadaceae bacterium]|nr:hypothetical protein [Pyrinomonadaceae bacterium]
MKTIKNLILVFALTTTFAFGDDGHTGGGNRCDTCTPPPTCTENCGGNIAAGETEVITGTGADATGEETSLIEYWSKIFFDMIG